MGVPRALCVVLAGAVVGAGLAAASTTLAQEGKPPLTLASAGGALTRGQMLAAVQPYRKFSGRWMNVEAYDLRLDEIRTQVRTANVTWDLATVDLPQAIAGCDEGLFAPIDPSILTPAPDGTPAADDFFEDALQECAIGFGIFATVVAYDRRRFAEPPTALADFFDLDQFPGRRGLQARAQVNLEWALLADGVAPSAVYDVLSTDEGLDRAFAVLDRIRDQVVWWRFGAEPPQLLATGRVAMSSAWSGQVFEEVEERDTPLGIVWDHQVWNFGMWATLKGAPNQAEALDFIKFASAPERLADLANLVAYGPARRSASALVKPDVRDDLPTAEGRRANAIRIDHSWWAVNGARIRNRFDAWLRGEDRFVYDFHPLDAE